MKIKDGLVVPDDCADEEGCSIHVAVGPGPMTDEVKQDDELTQAIRQALKEVAEVSKSVYVNLGAASEADN